MFGASYKWRHGKVFMPCNQQGYVLVIRVERRETYSLAYIHLLSGCIWPPGEEQGATGVHWRDRRRGEEDGRGKEKRRIAEK